MQELRSRLEQVEQLKHRREEIDGELNKVWTVNPVNVEGGEAEEQKQLEAPHYQDTIVKTEE